MELQTRCLASHRKALKKKSFYLSGLNLRFDTNLSPLHRVLICGTHVLPTTSILGLVSNRASRRKSLYGQHWWHAFKATKAARVRPDGSENQSRRAAEAGRTLMGYCTSGPILRARGYPNKANQPPSRRTFSASIRLENSSLGSTISRSLRKDVKSLCRKM